MSAVEVEDEFLDELENEESIDAPEQEDEYEASQEFIDDLVDKLIICCEEFTGKEFLPYQLPAARRLIESVILGDGAEITILMARQVGKTQLISMVLAGLMVFLPRLAPVFPYWLDKFEEGFACGIFAPTEEQADTMFGRVVSFLTCDRAAEFFMDPELDDKVTAGGTRGKGKLVQLQKSGSLCRMQTVNPKAKIEGRTYHMIVVDEAQQADETMISKSLTPMVAWNAGTRVLCGTAQTHKSYYYEAIQRNKREFVNAKRAKRQNHFEVIWTEAAKYNKHYAKSVQQDKLKLGEDSPEFRMSYLCEWMLEKGMFVAPDKLDRIYDQSMPIIPEFYEPMGGLPPVVVGIDVGRTHDSTVATAVLVDWSRPDAFGFYPHYVLNWLELDNTEWESQYFSILDFCNNYNIHMIGVDAQGMGSAVAERLQVIMPNIPVEAVGSDQKSQSERWKHLAQLIQRDQLVVPGHSKARRLKRWKKFNQQMLDLERTDKGPYMLAAAPEERGAYDDYADSLAIACWISTIGNVDTVEQLDFSMMR